VPGAVRPPSPEHKDLSENPSKWTRNAPRFQPYYLLVKDNMLPEDLGQNQNFIWTSPGRLDCPSYAVRPPSPDRTGKRGTAGQPSTLHHLILGLVFRCVPLRSRVERVCVLVPRSSGTPVATWAWPTWVVSWRRVLEAVFIS
jgi:hypothetical protein